MEFKIDYVLPMVNPFDPVWQKEYKKHFDDNPIYNVRHRKSPKLLRYMFRSIAKNMPWIDKVFIVVACQTQIPLWVNTETVNVILHKDIIPYDELPTFNTCTIDKYMNSIQDLAEHYIHAHDDHYAIKQIDAGQYFSEEGKLIKNNLLSILKFKDANEMAERLRTNKWLTCCNNSINVFKRTYGIDFMKQLLENPEIPFCAVQRHMPVPCVKSLVAKVISECGIDKMRFSIARDFSDVMMIVIDSIYAQCTGIGKSTLSNVVLPTYDKNIDEKMKNMDKDQFNDYMDSMTKGHEFLCINDSDGITRNFYENWLNNMFPDKCKYEV